MELLTKNYLHNPNLFCLTAWYFNITNNIQKYMEINKNNLFLNNQLVIAQIGIENMNLYY